MKNIVFLLGTFDSSGGFSDENIDLMRELAQATEGNVTPVVAVRESRFAGREKDVKLTDIRRERARVIKEINDCDPYAVFCFGRTAASAAFNKGSVVLDEYRRKCSGTPDIQGKIFVVDSLSRVAVQPGIKKWLHLDIRASLEGHTSTVWGDYTVLHPGTPEWDECPQELTQIRRNELLGFDLETYPGLDPWAPDARIRMAMFSVAEGRAYVVQCTPDSGLPAWAVALLANKDIIKSGSNIAFDYKWCKRFGYDVESMWDTATAEHVLDCTDPNKGLKDITFRYLPRLGHYSRANLELVKERGGWEHVQDDEMYKYAGADAETSFVSAHTQRQRIDTAGLYQPWSLSYATYQVLAKMQERGMCIDGDANSMLNEEMEQHLGTLRRQIQEVLGPVNPSSPAQLIEALKKCVSGVDLRVSKWKKILSDDEDEDTSTARKVLEREAHKHPVIGVVLEYRRWSKLHTAFVQAMRDKHMVKHGGRYFIHPSFLLSRTETYRLASSNPNAQQIPRKPGESDPDTLNIKRQFISRFDGGTLLHADYAQMEVRVAAMLSNDENLKKAIHDEDIHKATAALMLRKNYEDITEEERQAAKTIGFATMYGAGSNTISKHLGISKDEASGLMSQYFRAYPQLRQYISRVHGNVKRTHDVTTPFGFRRTFQPPPNGNWNQWEGFRIERQAFNTIIQSTAACIMYVALVAIEKEIERNDLHSLLIGTVHDSLLIDVYPGEQDKVVEIVRRCMKNPDLRQYMKVTVPLGVDVEVGKNWGEMEKLS